MGDQVLYWLRECQQSKSLGNDVPCCLESLGDLFFGAMELIPQD